MSEANGLVRAAELELDTQEYVRFEGTHLVFRPDTPFEVWLQSFSTLKNAHKHIQWWMADAYIFGKHKYGDQIYQALDALDYKKHTLENWVSVRRKFPDERLRDKLDFSHHEAVAALPRDVGDRILEQAEREERTVKETKDLRREWEYEQFGKPEVVQELCPHCRQPMP